MTSYTTDVDNSVASSAENDRLRAGCPCDHANPRCRCHVTDAERAGELLLYLRNLGAGAIPDVRLMPLGAEGKAPIIAGECGLDSDRAEAYLHTPGEAIAAVRDGHPGFALYAGRESHGTEEWVFLDRDDPEAWPDLPATLRVVSGSGTGDHLTYRNAGDVANAKGTGEYAGAGSVRATNWFVVVPGSVHPSGGIYHGADLRTPATLACEDLPDGLRPGSDSTGDGAQYPPAENPVDPRECYELVNDVGLSLRAVSRLSGRLDRLLSHRHPDGYDSPSEADMATVRLLLHYRFDPEDAATILRGCRARPKVYARPDYVARTIGRTTIPAPLPEGLCINLVRLTPNRGKPDVTHETIREVVLAVENGAVGPPFGVADLVDSGRVEWRGRGREAAKKRVRRALKMLAPWYLDLQQGGTPWVPGDGRRGRLSATPTSGWPEVAEWARRTAEG